MQAKIIHSNTTTIYDSTNKVIIVRQYLYDTHILNERKKVDIKITKY